MGHNLSYLKHKFNLAQTFGRRHHFPPYVIGHKGYKKMAFLVETPKWESWNWDSYCLATLESRIILIPSLFRTYQQFIL
jgi:hypothetical protein